MFVKGVALLLEVAVYTVCIKSITIYYWVYYWPCLQVVHRVYDLGLKIPSTYQKHYRSTELCMLRCSLVQ